MDWNLFWTQVVTAIGGQAVFLLVIAWLLRKLVSHWLNQGVDQYKHKLDLELERHKLLLTQQALEHEVAYRRIDERRAEALSVLFVHFARLRGIALRTIGASSDEQKSARLKEFSQQLNEYQHSAIDHRLYLPESLLEQIQSVDDALLQVFTTETFRYGEGESANENLNERIQAVVDMKDELDSAMANLVKGFQNYIGVSEPADK